MSLNEQISKAIQENLPSQTAGELSKVLVKYEELKINVPILNKQIEDMRIKHTDLITVNNDLQARSKNVQKFERELLEREKKLYFAENDLKVTKLEHELNCEKNNNYNIMNLCQIFFKKLDASDYTRSEFTNYQTTHGQRDDGSYGNIKTGENKEILTTEKV